MTAREEISRQDSRERFVATMRALHEAHPWWSSTSMIHAHEAVETALGLPHEDWKGDAAYPAEWTLKELDRAAEAPQPTGDSRERFEAWAKKQPRYGKRVPRLISEGAPAAGEYAHGGWQEAWEAWQAAEAQRPSVAGAVAEIAAERERQINVEGWTPEHDDEHNNRELAHAAASFAMAGAHPDHAQLMWPWGILKIKDERSNLIRAGALIVAEIERLDRAPRPAAGDAQETPTAYRDELVAQQMSNYRELLAAAPRPPAAADEREAFVAAHKAGPDSPEWHAQVTKYAGAARSHPVAPAATQDEPVGYIAASSIHHLALAREFCHNHDTALIFPVVSDSHPIAVYTAPLATSSQLPAGQAMAWPQTAHEAVRQWDAMPAVVPAPAQPIAPVATVRGHAFGRAMLDVAKGVIPEGTKLYAAPTMAAKEGR